MANDVQRDEDLICEALVREIDRASRWTARVEAWQALVSTRHRGQCLRADIDRQLVANGYKHSEQPEATGRRSKDEGKG